VLWAWAGTRHSGAARESGRRCKWVAVGVQARPKPPPRFQPAGHWAARPFVLLQCNACLAAPILITRRLSKAGPNCNATTGTRCSFERLGGGARVGCCKVNGARDMSGKRTSTVLFRRTDEESIQYARLAEEGLQCIAEDVVIGRQLRPRSMTMSCEKCR
jgi:hypothetical protein